VRVADIGVYGQGMAVRVLPENFLLYKRSENIFGDHSGKAWWGEAVEGKSSVKPSKQLRIVLRNCGCIDPKT